MYGCENYIVTKGLDEMTVVYAQVGFEVSCLLYGDC